MNSKFRLKLFGIPFLGSRFLMPYIVKKEGGQKTSKSLREYTMEKSNTFVGLYSYGGCFSDEFNVGGKVIIGRYCSFAKNIHYYGVNHPLSFASMSPYFYNKSFGFDVMDIQRNTLNVGNDVWIGANAIITSKCCKIGNGAVIGAGSIVTKDVPPYAVVAGNPARILRFRFNQDIIDELEKSRWWDLSPEELFGFYEYIDNPEKFAVCVVNYRNKVK